MVDDFSSRISIIDVIGATLPPPRISKFFREYLLSLEGNSTEQKESDTVEQMDNIDIGNYRYSPEANIVLTIYCSLIAQELILFGMRGAIAKSVKKVQPCHVYVYNIAESKDWPILRDLRQCKLSDTVVPMYTDSYGLTTYIKTAFNGIKDSRSADDAAKYSGLIATDEFKKYIENIIIEFIQKIAQLSLSVVKHIANKTIKDIHISLIIETIYKVAHGDDRFNSYNNIITDRMNRYREHKTKTKKYSKRTGNTSTTNTTVTNTPNTINIPNTLNTLDTLNALNALNTPTTTVNTSNTLDTLITTNPPNTLNTPTTNASIPNVTSSTPTPGTLDVLAALTVSLSNPADHELKNTDSSPTSPVCSLPSTVC